MITSTFALKPKTKLKLLPRAELFHRRIYNFFQNYQNTPTLHCKFLAINKNKHIIHILSFNLIARHLRCHTPCPSFMPPVGASPSPP